MLWQAESERIEYKADASSPRFREEVLQTICAFANNINQSTHRGQLFIGIREIKDQPSSPIYTKSGFSDEGGKIEEKIRHWIADWVVSPQPPVSIHNHRSTAGDVIEITIEPSTHIHWFDKNAWVRLGTTTKKANIEDLKRLESQKTGQSFDAKAWNPSQLTDISAILFAGYQQDIVDNAVIDGNHRSLPEQLAQQHFFDLVTHKPTTAGLLFFAPHPQNFFPLAFIDYVQSETDDLTDRKILDRKKIEGTLFQQWQALEALIPMMVTNRMTSDSKTFRELSFPSYPEIALREFLLNAIEHRDYALPAPIRIRHYPSSIEIHSPGGLLNPATPNNFPHSAAYRNPIIVATLARMRWIEHFGNGVERAKKALARNNNAPPRFEFNENFVRILISARI